MVREKFREFVQTQSLAVYHNRQALCGAVADIFFHDELLKNVLHTAISYGVVEKLAQSDGSTLEVSKAEQYLTQKHGIERNAAKQAMYILAHSLGIETEPLEEVTTFAGCEWLVLDMRDDATLILLKNITEIRSFHSAYEKVVWGESDIRHYLNNEFCSQMLAQDWKCIATVENFTRANVWYGTSGGNSTSDKIFLLSIEETLRYFGGGRIPDKSNDNGEFSDENNKNRLARDKKGRPCGWWLRSPGIDGYRAASVWGGGSMMGGKIYVHGDSVSDYRQGVRPALWLKSRRKP